LTCLRPRGPSTPDFDSTTVFGLVLSATHLKRDRPGLNSLRASGSSNPDFGFATALALALGPGLALASILLPGATGMISARLAASPILTSIPRNAFGLLFRSLAQDDSLR
jgi:hypothetical protein